MLAITRTLHKTQCQKKVLGLLPPSPAIGERQRIRTSRRPEDETDLPEVAETELAMEKLCQLQKEQHRGRQR